MSRVCKEQSKNKNKNQKKKIKKIWDIDGLNNFPKSPKKRAGKPTNHRKICTVSDFV